MGMGESLLLPPSLLPSGPKAGPGQGGEREREGGNKNCRRRDRDNGESSSSRLPPSVSPLKILLPIQWQKCQWLDLDSAVPSYCYCTE